MNPSHRQIHKAIKLLAPLLDEKRGRIALRRARSDARKADLHQARPWFTGVNIIGVCLSEKRTQGKRVPGTPCLRFIMQKKVPRSKLPDNRMIPERLRLRGVPGEILTDVVAWETFPVAHALQPGSRIQSPDGWSGTLGLFVNKAGQNCILSCAHVMAPGGPGVAAAGDLILQPDTGVQSSLLQFTPLARNADADADAALAVLPDGAEFTATKPPALLDSLAPEFDDLTMLLQRHGATSGDQQGTVVSAGTIDGKGAVVQLRYDDLGGLVTLHDLVLYGAPTSPGDSGAAVFASNSGALAGLHLGGLSSTIGGSASTSLMTPIRVVFDALNIPFTLDSVLGQ